MARTESDLDRIEAAGEWWQECEQYFDAALVGFTDRDEARFVDRDGTSFTLTGKAKKALDRFLDDNCAGG